MALIDYKNVEILRRDYLVLKDVSFKVNEGELVYIVGKVGSGKSSLLKTMYADVPIASGEAEVLDLSLIHI